MPKLPPRSDATTDPLKRNLIRESYFQDGASVQEIADFFDCTTAQVESILTMPETEDE